MKNRYFRAGVGTVIYKDAATVALFRRSKYPVGLWQFQQGGIDLGEDTETTLWRELAEEAGLVKEDFESTILMPNWTVYQDNHTEADNTAARFGQAHRWFFLKLKPTATIDLTKATDDEFDEWKWTSFEEALRVTGDRKKHVYETLHVFFRTKILQTPPR